MGASVTIDGTFTSTICPAFVMQAPRKRELDHYVQDGGIITDLIAVKDQFMLKYNHLTQAELNTLMQIYQQTGVNAIHTLVYSTPLIIRKWDGVSPPSPFVPAIVGVPAENAIQPLTGTLGVFANGGANIEHGFKFKVAQNGGVITKLFGNFTSGEPAKNVRLWKVAGAVLLAGPVSLASTGTWQSAAVGPISVNTTDEYIVSGSFPSANPARTLFNAAFADNMVQGNYILEKLRREGTLGVFPTIEVSISVVKEFEGLVDIEWQITAVPAVPGVNNDVNRIRKKIKFDVFDPPHKENVPNEYTVTLSCKET